jgi:putative heme-binding domain-containing protein
LASGDLSDDDRANLESQLARFGGTPAVEALLTETLTDPKASKTARLIALKAVARTGRKDAPAGWISALSAILAGTDADLARQAVSTARALAVPADKGSALTAPLLAIAGSDAVAADARLEALAAVPGGLARIEAPAFGFLLEQLAPERSVASRALAAEVITKAKLDASRLGGLVEALRKASPLEVDRLLSAFDAATDDALGVRLVKALGESSAIASLRIDALKLHLAKFGPETHKAAEGLYARLNADAAKQQAFVDALLAKVGQGDVRRGQLVFHSEKAACTVCHAIGYQGGNVGPDLTKVGGVRSERDLLEAIVYPSASLIRSYEPVVLATTDGKVYSGLLRNETSDELLLITGANQQVRVPRADVEEIRPGVVSVMPAGLDQQLTTQELVDLVAFLRACK